MSFLKNQKKISGAELFIKCLEQEGVEYIFGLPGEENLDFLGSSNNLDEPFKRTTSRLYELTSKNYS